MAEVAEVSIEENQTIRVHRVDAAVDCGLAANPQQALAQVQGGINFGLSAALFHEITVLNGAVVERSFPDYPMIQLANSPRVNVQFISSDAPLGGLEEPGVPPIAPAVANAVFALTGQSCALFRSSWPEATTAFRGGSPHDSSRALKDPVKATPSVRAAPSRRNPASSKLPVSPPPSMVAISSAPDSVTNIEFSSPVRTAAMP